MLNRIFRYYILIGIFLLSSLQLSRGEPTFTIRDNGDSVNRVDIAILDDGYTQSELGKFVNVVENLVNDFFKQEPFKEFQNYFKGRKSLPYIQKALQLYRRRARLYNLAPRVGFEPTA